MSVLSCLENMSYTENREDSSQALKWLQGHEKGFGHFIGGTFSKFNGDNNLDVIAPASEDVLAKISIGTQSDVDNAVKHARKAQSAWAKLSGHERALKLYALARSIQRNARLLAVLESLDNGKPIRETRDIDINLAARHFYHHAGWAQLMETEFPDYDPVGVVGQIIPWNFPFLMLAWKIAPALALGNTVVIKPAESTPLTALLFAELLQKSGIPKGVVNIITGDGSTGDLLARHDGVDKLAFTGSTKVGKHLREITAGSGKQLTLELGGKSPFIVFDDCDVDAAVEGVVDAIWFNQGQVCCAGSRLIVQEGIADRFYALLKKRMQKLRLGHSLDKTIDMGAIVSKSQLNRIQSMVDEAVDAGATLMQPDDTAPQSGFYYPPTVLCDVPTTAAAASEEIFGPVAVGITFRTLDEAIILANHSRYGLSASIWSENINLALEVSAKVDVGIVWVNGTNLMDASAGFGGRKESGFGREGGREGCLAYLKPRLLSTGKKRTPVTMAKPKQNSDVTVDRTSKLYIGGKQARPDGMYSHSIVGHDGTVLAEVPTGNRKDIRNAVESARKAASSWRGAHAHGKAQILYYMGENLSVRANEFTERIIAMTGKKQSDATKEVATSISRLFSYAAWADKFEGRIHNPPMRGLTLSLPEPFGVTGVICPSEMPLLGFISTVIPLVATGNTVVAIPSEIHPLSALDLYSVLETSDVPDGVINIVTGPQETLAQVLSEHHDVDAMWAFGSESLSANVEKLSATNLKRTFVDYGFTFDWLDPRCEGEIFLNNATEVKNIWVPYGE